VRTRAPHFTLHDFHDPDPRSKKNFRK